MTEPQGGSDPKVFTTTAPCRTVTSGSSTGRSGFRRNARWAEFIIVMAVTDPGQPLNHRMSMFIVPSDAPGLNIIRNVGVAGWEEPSGGDHAYIRYDNVRVPKASMLGDRGQAFVVAQTRLAVAGSTTPCAPSVRCKLALDMMCERAVSRRTQGEQLSQKQLVQEMIAESAGSEIEQFRLLVLQTAWKIDQHHDYRRVRADIAAVKTTAPDRAEKRGDASAAGARLTGHLARDALCQHARQRHPHRAGRRPDRGSQGHAGPPSRV